MPIKAKMDIDRRGDALIAEPITPSQFEAVRALIAAHIPADDIPTYQKMLGVSDSDRPSATIL